MSSVQSKSSTGQDSPEREFTPTGPGTLAGRYLRHFWQPVYHSVDLAAGDAVRLRIMSEDWTLYRGTSGAAYLVDSRCPHRGALLSIGRIEGEELRCFYHGWKFAGDGRCTEQPAEESSFCHKVAIRSAPVREYLGLIFAYVGDGTPPDFPLYPEFERFAGLVELDSYSRACNYFQNLENALDMSHVAFVHGDNEASFKGIGNGKRLAAVESSWGVTYTFTRDDGQLRIQQFGMPNVFYMNALPNDPDIGWQESLFWWVPIDDGSHMQFSLHRVPATGEAARRIHGRRQARRSRIDLAHQDVCEEILAGTLRYRDVDQSRVDMIRLQDDLAQLAQGRIADRETDRLGRADVGVIAIRKLWARELEALRRGGALTSWTRGALGPKIWGRAGAPAGDGTPEIVDVRPYIEIKQQLKALSGAG
jgi:5,5'-dehydrodivanillate O-demethylase oxygenase subunit